MAAGFVRGVLLLLQIQAPVLAARAHPDLVPPVDKI